MVAPSSDASGLRPQQTSRHPALSLAEARKVRTRGEYWPSRLGALHVITRGPRSGTAAASDGVRSFTGEKPPVLMIHGFSDNAATWRRLQRHIESEHVTIAIDLPGHGLSDTPPVTALTMADLADLIVEYMDAHGIERAFVCASSYGGGIALGMAARHAKRVLGLLLLGSVGVPFLPKAIFAPLYVPKLEEIGHHVARLPGLRRMLLAQIAFPNHHVVSDQDTEGYFAPWTIPGRPTFLKNLGKTIDQAEAVPWLEKITVPVTVVDCGRDHLVPPKVSRELARRIPGAVRVELPTAGHLPQIDHTEEVANLLQFAWIRANNRKF